MMIVAAALFLCGDKRALANGFAEHLPLSKCFGCWPDKKLANWHHLSLVVIIAVVWFGLL